MYEPLQHIRAGEIIRRHSTNRRDIRDLVLNRLPLLDGGKVLDLGCGYGFFYETKRSLANGALVVGVDSNEENREPFLERVAKAGGRGGFVCAQLPAALNFPDGHFDTILCFFSLYFFPDMLAEISRLLSPHGVFVAVTHCHDSFQELADLVGDHRLFEILRNFEDRNGPDVLAPYFSRIESERYTNDLVFGPGSLGDLDFYLDFKRPLWLDGDQAALIKTQVARVAERGAFRITKNDIVFICRP